MRLMCSTTFNYNLFPNANTQCCYVALCLIKIALQIQILPHCGYSTPYLIKIVLPTHVSPQSCSIKKLFIIMNVFPAKGH